jgi:phage gpG-like protein
MIDFKIQDMVKRLQNVKQTIPIQLANLGQNFFSRAFQASKSPTGIQWPARKNETKKTQGKHLLVKTGNLRASIYHSIRSYSWSEIKWGTDVPYAKYHNEGTDTIPQREFMGDSPELRRQIHEKLRKEILTVFKK